MIERIKRRVIRAESGCLEWTGATAGRGYGVIGDEDRRMCYVHRAMYEYHREPIPDGKVIDHLCRNIVCCEPEHLEVVDTRTNLLRGIGPTAINAAKTHCPQGHMYDKANTYWETATGGRHCRQCGAIRARDRRARSKEARK